MECGCALAADLAELQFASLNMSRSSVIGIMSRMKVKPPSCFISRTALVKAASAMRDKAPPTLMRLTPACESWLR